jgi:succinyl-CoA synthetase beta subunit
VKYFGRFPVFQSLVVKPDQLIKRRGKLGLIKVKASLEEVKQWIGDRMGKDQEVSMLNVQPARERRTTGVCAQCGLDENL